MGTLFDQLKKTGLVDEKKAKQFKKNKHKQAKKQKGKKNGPVDESKQQAQQAIAEKAAKDKQLNLQRKKAAEKKSIAAQVKQLVEENRIEKFEGDIRFNFVDGMKVERLFVTEEIQSRLTKGALAIVKPENRYELVPAETAAKIKLRDPLRVVYLQVEKETENAEDDPYAEYKVPDDLMW